MLTVTAISYEVQQRLLVKDISFQMKRGELLSILGANGAGKSTLLRMLSGERKPSKGEISLFGKPLGSYSPAALAKRRAVLNQQNAISMPFLAHEVVMMGRYPHYRNSPREEDRRAIQETMDVCGISHLAERSFLTLSGGEQQRVQFARVLAQVWDQPESLILMDEPVVGLDLQYQQQTLAIARALCTKGFMVIAILHEINLAAQYADRILMLKNGRKWQDGSPTEVLSPPHIYTIFNVETEVIIDQKTLRPYVIQKMLKMHADKFNSLLPPDDPETLPLKERYNRYVEGQPKASTEEIARALNVSESALMHTLLGEQACSLPTGSIGELWDRLAALKMAWVQTQNSHCLLELKGRISSNVHGDMDRIRLNVLFNGTEKALLTDEQGCKQLRIFDAKGKTVLKIYETEEMDPQLFDLLLAPAAPATPNHFALHESMKAKADAFGNEWMSMQQTDDLHLLCQRFGLSHAQALRAAPQGEKKNLSIKEIKNLLSAIAQFGLVLTVVAGNESCFQSYTGTIKNIVSEGTWYCINERCFRLRLSEDAVERIDYVKRPIRDGIVHSFELYDKEAVPLVQFMLMPTPKFEIDVLLWK